jgi:hypothetical protein
MKTRWLMLFGVALTSYAAGVFTPVAFTQSTKPPKYVAVAYMKVPAGKEGGYLAMESDLWKPIHRKLIASGAERSWTLYGVLSAGTADPYNFVTVQELDSLDQYFGADYAKVMGEAHPGKPVEGLMDQTFQARDGVSVKLWERIDHVE